MKTLIQPLLRNLPNDQVIPYKTELTQLQEMFIITQVDKDSSGIAFVCKVVAHKLTKQFIYGLNPGTPGLFFRDIRPLKAVVKDLKQYTQKRQIYTSNTTLPQFKIIMKMHKNK